MVHTLTATHKRTHTHTGISLKTKEVLHVTTV